MSDLRFPSEISPALHDIGEDAGRICWFLEAIYVKTIDACRIQEKILWILEAIRGILAAIYDWLAAVFVRISHYAAALSAISTSAGIFNP